MRLLLCSLFFLVGCATYQGKVASARDKLVQDQPAAAASLLEKKANQEGNDQLIYVLDYATALQAAGRFKDSNKAFAEADDISAVKDYHSISRITGSFLLSEEMVQYKGEDYEKVLINAFSAINYLMMDNLDDALVETRRLNEKLYKYKFEAKRNYEQNVFAIYLGAIIWEANNSWDDAYISYKQAYDLAPNYEPLHEDLIRAAYRDQRPEEVARWRKKFPDIKVDSKWKDPGSGELVLIYQQGWGPRKGPRPESPRFPKLYHVPTITQTAKLEVADVGSVNTQEIYSVEAVAIKTLEDAYGELVARRVGGIVAKAVVADQIRQKNELLGNIAWIAMNAADRADLRQWSTLPETFQLARMRLKAGKYKIKVTGLTAAGTPSGEAMQEREIEIKPGKKIFVNWRSWK